MERIIMLSLSIYYPMFSTLMQQKGIQFSFIRILPTIDQ